MFRVSSYMHINVYQIVNKFSKNASTCKFIFQIIRNFTVEYIYEMKIESIIFHVPASPLKFKMVERECWKGPVNLLTSDVTNFEDFSWFKRVNYVRESKKVCLVHLLIFCVREFKSIKFHERHQLWQIRLKEILRLVEVHLLCYWKKIHILKKFTLQRVW